MDQGFLLIANTKQDTNKHRQGYVNKHTLTILEEVIKFNQHDNDNNDIPHQAPIFF